MKFLPETQKEKRMMAKRLGIIIAGLIFLLTLFWILCVNMPGSSWKGSVPPLSEEEQQLKERLKKHVTILSEEIGERNHCVPENFRKTVEYIQQIFTDLGLTPVMHEYEYENETFVNIAAEIKGTQIPDEIIVIGGHYDTACGTPGADDNATAVAALLETARDFLTSETKRTVRFVTFANEEPPFFHTDGMGSLQYARACRKNRDNITAMYCYESLGYYTNEPDSQPYPVGLIKWWYPDTGNFIAFVSDLGSRGLIRSTIKDFRETGQFPSEGLAAPQWVPGVSFSDQWSFWKCGYKAVMITDTPILRNPHYHKSSDTPEHIDFDSFTKVTSGVIRTILKAVNR